MKKSGSHLFVNPCGLASQIADVEQLGAPYFALARPLDLRDLRGMQKENPLDANAAGYFPHGKRGVDSCAAPLDAQSFENLNAFFVSFDHAKVHIDIVSGTEIRDLSLELIRGHRR
jgi:hypothetical protein